MPDKKLSEALGERKYMGIMFKLGGMVEIEDDPTILLDAIRHLESELAFQTQNAAGAHSERAHQFRRAADALDEVERRRAELTATEDTLNAAMEGRQWQLERAVKAEAEVARLNRWITQIHYSLAEQAETELEIWAMRALEWAMRGAAAG